MGKLVYNARMPVPTVVSAIVSSVISSAVQSPAPEPVVPVIAIARPLPAAAKKGLMLPPANGFVSIDGKELPLSPTAQFRSPQNLIVMPMSIQESVRVRYLTDASGAVYRVWLLTPAEIAASDSN